MAGFRLRSVDQELYVWMWRERELESKPAVYIGPDIKREMNVGND
jgi:hypothetical protein